jgi:hypothetical protein
MMSVDIERPIEIVTPNTPFDARQRTRLLDELPDPTLILGADFNLLWANHQAEEVFQAASTRCSAGPWLSAFIPTI